MCITSADPARTGSLTASCTNAGSEFPGLSMSRALGDLQGRRCCGMVCSGMVRVIVLNSNWQETYSPTTGEDVTAMMLNF